MRKPPPLSAIALLLLAFTLPAGAEDSRRIGFSYRATIGPVPEGAGPVHVFIPVPVENEHQQVDSLEIRASIPGAVESEPVYGNRFWHGQLAVSDGRPIEIVLDTTVRRRVQRAPVPRNGGGRPLTAAEKERFARYLGPNERVVVAHEVLDPILAEIRANGGGDGPPARSRATYDWVVDNVEYKKVGTGWGNGDSFWACSERYGNCTDFHALFISLARTEGIPARFEMGFPVPEGRAEGEIGGYHCWVEFYLSGPGWIPIDASEASKHPEKRELFYGTQPADRIHFSTGRDLRLGPDHRAAPLNYFVYPHVEVAGEAWTGPIEKSFRFHTP